jgi:hypothetical protein
MLNVGVVVREDPGALGPTKLPARLEEEPPRLHHVSSSTAVNHVKRFLDMSVNGPQTETNRANHRSWSQIHRRGIYPGIQCRAVLQIIG